MDNFFRKILPAVTITNDELDREAGYVPPAPSAPEVIGLTPKESRLISEFIFERLSARGDPIKVLEAEIKVNRHVAKQCRDDFTPGLGRAFDALADSQQLKLDKLLEEQANPPRKTAKTCADCGKPTVTGYKYDRRWLCDPCYERAYAVRRLDCYDEIEQLNRCDDE